MVPPVAAVRISPRKAQLIAFDVDRPITDVAPRVIVGDPSPENDVSNLHNLVVALLRTRPSASVEYGIELVAGLYFFSETTSLAPSFEALNSALDGAHTARRALRKPLLEKRAAFRFTHYDTDQIIRSFFRAVEIADGGRRGGPLSTAIFPDGLGRVVAPYGTRQIAPTEALIGRLKLCKLPGSAELGAAWAEKLEASLAKLKSAAAAHAAARATRTSTRSSKSSRYATNIFTPLIK